MDEEEDERERRREDAAQRMRASVIRIVDEKFTQLRADQQEREWFNYWMRKKHDRR